MSESRLEEGDIVYQGQNGVGTVSRITLEDDYPVRVDFANGISEYFTLNGEAFTEEELKQRKEYGSSDDPEQLNLREVYIGPFYAEAKTGGEETVPKESAKNPLEERIKEANEILNRTGTPVGPTNPAHYRFGNIECIEAIKASMTPEGFHGFLKGNVQKYIWRYEHKHGLEDLKKAAWYLNRLIAETLDKEAGNAGTHD